MGFAMKNILSVVVMMMVGIAFAATPTITNVKAQYLHPWGKVAISYEVHGDVSASAETGMQPHLWVSAKDGISGKEYCAYSSCLSGDIDSKDGLHRIVWDMGKQGASINSEDVVFTVSYSDALYLVVDLSAGQVGSYPVSYVPSAPSGGWTDEYKTTKLVLRLLPAGKYMMQNTSTVTLTKPFYMAVFEVTQKQWELVMGSNPCSSTTNGRGDNYPVHYVSYDMIRGSSNGTKWPLSSSVDLDSFIGKLRARTGHNFDLPTEAQWEYACRAKTRTTYYWGNSMNDNYAWYKNNASCVSHVVGTRMPNDWGLYDMSGNVTEWCLDWYGALTYTTDTKGPSSGSSRVLRGGSYYGEASYCTSSYRSIATPSYYGLDDGFRLACSVEQ